MNSNSKHLVRNLIGIWLVVVIASLVTVYFERQNIDDWLALYNYTPAKSISSLASADGMTAYTRKVFYVNHPLIEPKTLFARVCPSNSEQTVVLGCYHLDQQGIFILSVNNQQLNGIEQVTAAYETLHAIYQRLNPSALKSLNSELTSFEYHGLSDTVVINQIATFRKTEPGEVLNEMTSLFGTEIQTLPSGLNQFYAKYFSNRQTLINYYEAYQSAFINREQQITAYDNQLSSLKSEISSDETSLDSQLSVIDAQKTTLSNLKSSSQITQYNQQVPGYNQLIDNYNSEVETVTSLISQYNQIITTRNALALEEQQLTAAITSSTQTLPN